MSLTPRSATSLITGRLDFFHSFLEWWIIILPVFWVFIEEVCWFSSTSANSLTYELQTIRMVESQNLSIRHVLKDLHHHHHFHRILPWSLPTIYPALSLLEQLHQMKSHTLIRHIPPRAVQFLSGCSFDTIIVVRVQFFQHLQTYSRSNSGRCLVFNDMILKNISFQDILDFVTCIYR